MWWWEQRWKRGFLIHVISYATILIVSPLFLIRVTIQHTNGSLLSVREKT